ncbi:MAG TPA: hypothetical protein VGH81_01895 [Rudaea sp.]|jgi:hypothetical protein
MSARYGLFWIMALALPLAGRAETPQDFSGEWVAATKDQQRPPADGSTNASPSGTHHGGRGMGGGGMGGMGGGHGGGMGGGRHHSGGAAPDGSGTATASLQGDPRVRAQALTIRQSDVVFDVAADGGKRTVYRFDNRNNYGAAYGGTVTLTWSMPDMVIETHPDAGGSIEERYTLSDDGKKLTMHVHEQVAGSDTPRDVTRVFVRNGSQDAATPTTVP